MIADARVLQETFVPHEIVHRDAEIQALASALRPLAEQEEMRCEHLFLHGPSGSGKTCLARYTLEQLKQHRIDLKTAYINCWENYNRFRVLYKALERLGKTLDVHRQSTPRDELLTRLREANERPYVIVLDEVDQLEEHKVLYDLYDMPHTTLVMIANAEDFFAGLEERIRSRLMSARRTRFEQYRHAALVSILEDRIRWGLEPESVSTEHIEEMADAAAGDARVAIGILRNAARIAEEENVSRIDGAIVERAVPPAKRATKKNPLEKLNKHQKLLYDIITEEGEIAPRLLYMRYEDRAHEPKSRRTLRSYLQKMVHAGAIAAHGEKKGRTYSA